MVPKAQSDQLGITQSPYAVSLKAAEADLTASTGRLAEVENKLLGVEEELKALAERKESLEDEKSRTQTRIDRFKASIEALKALCEEEHETRWEGVGERIQKGEWGIQECCYQVLLEAGHSMTASQILDQLLRNGLEPTRYDNVLAVIHTSLKRLVPDRVRSHRARAKGGGKRIYVWYAAVGGEKPTQSPGN
jgi:septal ring factor EnvC (AmiA/AmiB activator)